MAEAVKGSKLVYLYRKYSAASTTAGAILAFTTENSRSVSKDADSTATKDGTIRTPGVTEIEISATSIMKKGDATIKNLEADMLADALYEIWEANLEDPVSTGTSNTKFYGKYFQGYITNLELSSNAEDFVEVTVDFGVNGDGATGEVTVTASQQEAASYVFRDTPVQA